MKSATESYGRISISGVERELLLFAGSDCGEKAEAFPLPTTEPELGVERSEEEDMMSIGSPRPFVACKLLTALRVSLLSSMNKLNNGRLILG